MVGLSDKLTKNGLEQIPFVLSSELVELSKGVFLGKSFQNLVE